jgi:predicted aminopeptidase
MIICLLSLFSALITLVEDCVREYFMRRLFSIPLLILLCGCADLGYYWHSANGHLALMNQRVDIDDLLADETLDGRLRERLLLVREIRRFSIDELDLPANGSYLSYVELQQPWVIQNLFAAPEFSTRLQQWCYPVIGCASYRGYYDEARLLAYVDELQSMGLEVYVARVPAYSTLGWFDDPVLSSFLDWPDYRLAGLIFHELTHQRIYIEDDTTFNESLASAVQQAGTALWLQSRNQPAALDEFSRWLAYRGDVIALITATRARLAAIYQSDLDDADKRLLKARQFDTARSEQAAIAARHGITAGFALWFASELNNAKIGSVAAYNSRLLAFMHILERQQYNFPAFYRYVDRIAGLERGARDRCLDAWEQDPATIAGFCPELN